MSPGVVVEIHLPNLLMAGTSIANDGTCESNTEPGEERWVRYFASCRALARN